MNNRTTSPRTPPTAPQDTASIAKRAATKRQASSLKKENGIPTPLKSIRRKCMDCCAGQINEVKWCQCPDCALFPYRFGRNPKEADLLVARFTNRGEFIDMVAPGQEESDL